MQTLFLSVDLLGQRPRRGVERIVRLDDYDDRERLAGLGGAYRGAERPDRAVAGKAYVRAGKAIA